MDLKLNIYDKREIVKTYVADPYDLMFGTVEDFLNLVDVEHLDLNDNNSLFEAGVKVVTGGMDVIKPLIKDIFVDLTDDELKRTKVKDIVKILMDVIIYSVSEFSKGNNRKN